MKKTLFVLLCLTLIIGRVSAKSLNSDQLELRQNIVSFLKEEGFMPEIDSDGDVRFKCEGTSYYVIIDEDNITPMYLTLYLGYNYTEKRNKSYIESIVSEINKYKGLKIIISERSYSLRIEMFLVNAEHFRYTFYKHMDILKQAMTEI